MCLVPLVACLSSFVKFWVQSLAPSLGEGLIGKKKTNKGIWLSCWQTWVVVWAKEGVLMTTGHSGHSEGLLLFPMKPHSRRDRKDLNHQAKL